jgi:hypothetical protein
MYQILPAPEGHKISLWRIVDHADQIAGEAT